MALYTVILLGCFFAGRNFSYAGWAGLFAAQWFKIATFVTLLSLLYHAWVGMREILMDYVTFSTAVRLALQSATILWLIGCAVYAAQILWSV
jgi:succinate dehydrogenase / fumarate reductase membrane anchor subunit